VDSRITVNILVQEIANAEFLRIQKKEKALSIVIYSRKKQINRAIVGYG